jgi:hypothetical protein
MSGEQPDWSTILVDAVNKPGIISTAYSRFWNYSTGNQLLALFQCLLRSLEPGPINTFIGWRDLGRHVVKGQKALTLCMPITVKRKPEASESIADDHAESSSTPATFTRFVYRANWFLLCQTEGKEYVATELPKWNETAAIASLGVERVVFKHLNGNTQGYALDRQIAVSPIAALPHKTLFHELAHVVLGHCEELHRMDDDEHTSVSLREVEAECVALICCESLNLAGSESCRGYIQHWLGNQTLTDRIAQRIFKASDLILKAGRPQQLPAAPR